MSDIPLRRDADEVPTVDELTLVPSDPHNRFAAIVVPTDEGSSECTIFPVDVTEEELLTTWVSAESGSYVSLAEMR